MGNNDRRHCAQQRKKNIVTLGIYFACLLHSKHFLPRAGILVLKIFSYPYHSKIPTIISIRPNQTLLSRKQRLFGIVFNEDTVRRQASTMIMSAHIFGTSRCSSLLLVLSWFRGTTRGESSCTKTTHTSSSKQFL